MWDNLLELTHLNSSKGSRISALIERSSEGQKQNLHLYQQLLQGKFHKSDFDDLTQDDAASYELDSLHEELIHNYFFSNLERSGFNDRKSAEVECWKNWVAVKMLFGKSAMVFPQKTCLKILKQADRYGFHKLIIEVAKQLRLYYGAQLGDSKRFKKYDALIKLHRKKYQRAKQAARQLNVLKLSYLLKNKTESALVALSQNVLDDLSSVPKEEQSFSFGYHKYLLELAKHSLQKNIDVLNQTCREAIQFTTKALRRHQGNENRIFYLVSAFGLMRKGDFSGAMSAVSKTHHQEKKGSPVWVENMAFKFVLAVNAGQINRASAILNEVKSQSKFKLLLPEKMMVWMTFENYLQLLADLKKIDRRQLPTLPKGHLGMSKEEIFESDPEGLWATHHHIIEMTRMAIRQDKEGVRKYAAILKASQCSLREKGHFRLAAFSEFLAVVVNPQSSAGQLKKMYINNKPIWNSWPFLPDVQQRIFEEIIPFDQLIEFLQENNCSPQVLPN